MRNPAHVHACMYTSPAGESREGLLAGGHVSLAQGVSPCAREIARKAWETSPRGARSPRARTLMKSVSARAHSYVYVYTYVYARVRTVMGD